MKKTKAMPRKPMNLRLNKNYTNYYGVVEIDCNDDWVIWLNAGNDGVNLKQAKLIYKWLGQAIAYLESTQPKRMKMGK